MQNLFDYARKAGIQIIDVGRCQFCNAGVSRGVLECHENLGRISELLDFNNPLNYETRFLSVDAMALQHCEVHGPWNNYIHLARLYLIFEKKLRWDYSKTPLLSNVINAYKKNKKDSHTPPPPGARGKLTSSHLLTASTPEACVLLVKAWAEDVYRAFDSHHELVAAIADNYLKKYG